MSWFVTLLMSLSDKVALWSQSFYQLSSVLPALSGSLVWYGLPLIELQAFLNCLPPKSLLVSIVPFLGVDFPTLFQIQSFPLGRVLELSDLKVKSCSGGFSLLLVWTPVLWVCWIKGYQDSRDFDLLYLEETFHSLWGLAEDRYP